MRVTGATDFLWVRLVDVAGALAARRYEVEGELVIEVDDAFLPDNSGRYRLDGGPDGASAARTDAAPDVRMSVVDLGAAYLGAAPFTTLARAGRAEEVTPGALRRADAMFRSTPAAYSNTPF
jgi:predicted acetyltransferase